MRLETTFYDRLVHGALLGKRQIYKPIKYNFRSRRTHGFVEFIYSPQNGFEKSVSQVYRAIEPWLAMFTYKYHVERAREGGFRVEDVYSLKFWKEGAVHFHIYAQYFHPETLLERVRDVMFFRQPRRLFKGIRVPDWAQSHRRDKWDIDLYSRQAWDNAIEDLRSEWTPTPFVGERLEPNVLQWFRFEQYGNGFSSRLFYNEKVKDNFYRQSGHFGEKEKELYSFKFGNQLLPLPFGIDTTTPEGQAEFEKEWEKQCQMTPELFNKEDMVYPHQIRRFVSQEPHFQRVWKHYRRYVLSGLIHDLVEEGVITKEEVTKSRSYIGERGAPSEFLFGFAEHLNENDEGLIAARKIFEHTGLSSIKISQKTSQPYEEQFWAQFDELYNLSEANLMENLSELVGDPNERQRIEAFLTQKDERIDVGDQNQRIEGAENKRQLNQ